MFDIGVSELAVIGVVAMIVIGPEELPRVARTAGHLLGRLRRYVADVKSDIGREMELAELKRMQEQVQESAQDVKNAINEQMQSVENDLQHAIPGSVAPIATPVLPESPLAPQSLAATVESAQSHAEETIPPVERDENQLDMFGGEPPHGGRS